MTSYAVEVSGLTKQFKIPLDRGTTLKYRMTHLRSSSRFRNFLALDDVSFTVSPGEFVGITGPNGCGKSTLLKILSNIYVADSGRVSVNGRVSPFLELGVGFNVELTARENIFLGGAVLGLTRRQLAERVDTILEFAELTDFADQKIKNFSSGMAVRLAFSVAIQAEADLLLMDEVLAVGDARFQAKCFDVFADYKRQGRTVVLVSHDLSALSLYCDRVLLLEHGKLIADGPSNEVIAKYRRLVGMESEPDIDATREAEASHAPMSRRGSREVEITAIRILDANGQPHQSIMTSEQASVEVGYRVNAAVDELVCRLEFRRADGLSIAAPNTKTARYRIPGPPIGTEAVITYALEDLPLLGATYVIDATITDGHLGHEYDHVEAASRFRVADELGREGIIELSGKWSDSTVEADGSNVATPATNVT